ncbi:hypothetical protein [Bariatricus sp. HCP28S3_C2]|uniref:hypothetical protein n=1 Tax=unclassified Bariatricus TaxID=2677046 RepID=UPI003F8AC749
MKKYKKSSLKYKNRAWVIVFTSILQLLNFMIVWVNTKASIYLFLIIFAIFGLVTEIKSDFCVVVRDMHIPQELRIRSRGTERHSASN